MKNTDKKGVSTVIVTVILITLSLVAVGIVWAVINSIIKQKSENIETGGAVTLNLKVDKVAVGANGGIDVGISRGAGEGALGGVAIVISDGTNSQVIEKQEVINPLETKIYSISDAELTVYYVAEVSVAPLIKSGDKLTKGNIINTKEVMGTGWVLLDDFISLIDNGV